jgi:hypothetical protein
MNTTQTQSSNPNGNMGIQINMSITDPTMGMNQTNTYGNMGNSNTTFSTPNGSMNATSTTSSTTSSTIIQNGQVVNDSYQHQQTTTITQNGQTTQTTTTSTTPPTTTNYGITTTTATKVPVTPTNGFGNCANVLSNTEQFLNALNEESFETDRVAKVQGDLKSTCVSSSQAHQIVELFTFDTDKLTVAMYLYDRMTDKQNANTLLDLFTFETDQTKYKSYTSSH